MFKAIRAGKGIVVVAAAVALAVGSLGFGSSEASAYQTRTTTQMSAATAVSVSSISTVDSRAALGRTLVLSTDSQVRIIQAGATGDGPADQKECHGYARLINHNINEAQQADSEVETDIWLQGASNAANTAMDRGCFLF